MKKRALAVSCIAIVSLLLISSMTYGQTGTCSINASSLYFGNMINPVTVAPAAESNITVNCTAGLAYTIELNEGIHYNAANRSMLSIGSQNTILYNLNKDNQNTPWGNDNLLGTSKAGIGSGTDQNHTVFGKVFGTGDFPVSSYTDNVTATVRWNDGAVQSTNANFSVVSVVEGSCTVSASSVLFGQIRLPVTAPPEGQGSISVNCSQDLMYTIELDGGGYYMHPMRRMMSDGGSNFLGYTLYKDLSCIDAWQVGPAGAKPWTGSGVEDIHTVCGRAWPMGNEPVGTYRDTVIATVNW